MDIGAPDIEPEIRFPNGGCPERSFAYESNTHTDLVSNSDGSYSIRRNLSWDEAVNKTLAEREELLERLGKENEI